MTAIQMHEACAADLNALTKTVADLRAELAEARRSEAGLRDILREAAAGVALLRFRPESASASGFDLLAARINAALAGELGAA